MDLGLKGKKVFVQGASTGIGYAIAKSFVEEGARVCICSSNEERARKAAEEMGAEAFFEINLDRENGGVDFVSRGVERLGGIDVLVTNTGGPKSGYFKDLQLGDWQAGFRHLWMSAVESIYAAIPLMKAQQFGRVLLLTSLSAKEPIPGLTLSNSFRSGLLGLMKSLSHEVAKEGITVNAVLPGYTKTERLAELGVQEKELALRIPMHRLGMPEEIAALFVFLASLKASYLTGQAIGCDGGSLHGL